jgi:predicted TIM-barrel fold metal-dependent hydrolase
VSAIEHGAIDCDVHVEPPSMDALLEYLDPYWHEYIWGGRIGIGHGLYPPAETLSARSEARAAGSFPPRSYEALRSELLDPYRPRAVVLTCVASFQAGRNPYYEAAITRAINEWMRTEFLDRDERLFGSIVVPTLDPEAAADEIDRLSGDRRFAQVLLPVRSETPWGNVRYRALHAAVARNNVPIALHAWGGVGMAPTTTGGASSYFEDYLYNSQIIAPAQVLSLVAEGVFERHPSIRVVLSELGFGWIPSLMWRYDKDWKALWRETPWVHERPSAYIKRHFRATTSPTQIPRRVTGAEVEQFVAMLGASEFLMYSSDYPHDHGEDGSEKLLAALGTEGREAVLRGNAAAFYGIGASSEASPLGGNGP